MPFKKRLTPAQRLKKQLPKGWKAALRHPLMKKLTYGKHFDPTAENVVKAITLTKTWRGASYTEKLFVLCLDLLLEKAFDTSVLDADTYNRLQNHLENNQDKMRKESNITWQVWCWDYYHDHYRLQIVDSGDLILPKLPAPAPKSRVKNTNKKKLKRKKIRKLH